MTTTNPTGTAQLARCQLPAALEHHIIDLAARVLDAEDADDQLGLTMARAELRGACTTLVLGNATVREVVGSGSLGRIARMAAIEHRAGYKAAE